MPAFSYNINKLKLNVYVYIYLIYTYCGKYTMPCLTMNNENPIVNKILIFLLLL